MTHDEIFALIQRRLAELMEREPSQIDEDTKLVDDLDADSLDLVELAMAIEDELKLEIPDELLEGIRTVGDAVDLVSSRLGERD